ncbi:cation:proton antiporter regulatory subunit [Paenibacillus mendelii]|uniref:Cation:proton antiporter regulatory subunit n=1 Tax=Paenibacillus mendelii TaxID=206163 RepID=A0ABV6J4A5_9BACL|nr:cation:proton antiporter regulatory subunit [Paenibacillus mendelii]MCQ6561759.1 cation:proton antiporter regulatory subunit [Paenibacillus mendelii]
MNLKETDLPGIGRKYTMNTRSGDTLVIVVHNDERRDLFHLSPEEPDEMLSMVSLDDDEARSISAILAGITYKPAFSDSQEIMLDGLVIEWIRQEPLSKSDGMTIGQLDVRGATGASILAVAQKNKKTHMNPGSDFIIGEGMTFVVAGERAQIKQLKLLLRDGKL